MKNIVYRLSILLLIITAVIVPVKNMHATVVPTDREVARNPNQRNCHKHHHHKHSSSTYSYIKRVSESGSPDTRYRSS